MGFFGRSREEDPAKAEALTRIEGGGIPPSAERRLRGLAEAGLFTTGLSVNEFALLRALDAQPLAQVMGASVVRTGWQYLPALPPGINVTSWYSGRGAGYGPTVTGSALKNPFADASHSQVRNYQWHENVVCGLDVLADAWNTARRRALDRLAEEALGVGADAVVGVHLHHSDQDVGKGSIEYVVTGTAVRLPGSDRASCPVLTDVSLQDYWRLESAGHEPVGLVATTAVVFASASRSTRLRRLRTTASNQELDELSRGFQATRETIRATLRGQVADAHGTGAVGVELSHSVHRETIALASSLTSDARRGWHRSPLGIPYRIAGRGDVERRGWVITMHAAGTAIRRREGRTTPGTKTAVRMGAS